MSQTLIAKATVTINAPAHRVWEALTDPKLIKQYFFGADVLTDWKEGSPILYQGIYQGKAYQDKGSVLKVEPEKLLITTHWSPLSGTPDSPENYHQVRYDIVSEKGGSQVTISQDNNASKEEQEQNASNWKMVLEGMKKLLEG